MICKDKVSKEAKDLILIKVVIVLTLVEVEVNPTLIFKAKEAVLTFKICLIWVTKNLEDLEVKLDIKILKLEKIYI